MLPLLRAVAEGSGATRDLVPALAGHFALSEAERVEMLGSGRQTRFANRVHWALAYLGKARLLERTGRGAYRVTADGAALLAAPPERITINFLAERYEAFRQFRAGADAPETAIGAAIEAPSASTIAFAATPASTATPEETIEAALAAIETRLRDDLLERLLAAPPAFFEKTVMRLMQAMGYGVGAEHLGGAGDGGVDAVIFEDRLGLDLIYIQAKRYAADRAIPADALRGFSGALDDKGARKGVFLTTSRFTADAEAFARRQQHKRLVLVDGPALCGLMLRHGVGVREDRTLSIKRLDTAYFEPDGD